jgi:hypothetical protein
LVVCRGAPLLFLLFTATARSGEADASQPVYIVEIGAGHGKLAFLILRELMAAAEQFPVRGRIPFKYVLTDFNETTAAAWLEHECLKPYFDAGVLDYAVFGKCGRY